MFNGFKFESVCRSHEEVGLDTQLLQRLNAPETTLKKMADPVSESLSSKRYASRPQLWQVSRGERTVTNNAMAGAQLFSFSAAVGSKRFTLTPTVDIKK